MQYHTGEHATADDLRDRMAEAIAQLVKPNHHGQLCPIWAQRRTEPPISRCNCWILPDARKQADAAIAEVAPELERLRALTAACTCGTTYHDYQGPEPDCPVHGAVRAYNEAQAEVERLRADLAEAQLATGMAIAKYSAEKERADKAESEGKTLREERDALRAAIERVRTLTETRLGTERLVPATEILAALDGRDLAPQTSEATHDPTFCVLCRSGQHQGKAQP
jgi:hypothetical protein